MDEAIQLAEAEYASRAADARQRRRDAWHTWAADALANGGGRLYRWIRADGTAAAGLVPDPADPAAGGEVGAVPGVDAPPGTRRWILAFRGGPAAKLRAAERHWKSLWQRPARPGPPGDWLAELGGLPDFPARQPWTAAMVRAVLGRMRPHKAPGLDGWTVAELRLIPDPFLELIV